MSNEQPEHHESFRPAEDTSDEDISILKATDEAHKKQIDLPRKGSLNLRLLAKNIRFWAINLAIIVSVIAIMKLIIQQLRDTSYHIEAFRMPEEFEKMGYDGTTVAFQLVDEVNEMIAKANVSRTVREVEEFNRSSEKTSLQVEVIGGTVLSVETVAAFIRQVFGIQEKMISGEVVRVPEGLVMHLRLSGQKPEHIHVANQPAGSIETLRQLIRESSSSVLMKTNPFLLGLYTMPIGKNPTEDSLIYIKCMRAFKETIMRTPSYAVEAYAGWGKAIFYATRDTRSAVAMIQKAMKIDSANAFVYRTYAALEWDNAAHEHAEKLYARSVELDPTSAETWSRLGSVLLDRNSSEVAKAEEYERKSLAIDPTYLFGLTNLAECLFIAGRYEEARDVIERAQYYYEMDPMVDAVSIPIYEALADTVEATRIFSKSRKFYAVDMASNLNWFAFRMETHGQLKQSWRYAFMAIQADSTSFQSSFYWSTLAEVRALESDREGFYKYMDRAFKLGLPWGVAMEQEEPYKQFANETRFHQLKKKYGK